MKRDFIFSVCLILCVGMLPGCGKVFDWARDNFDQGREFKNEDLLSEIRNQINSATVYDLFSVAGKFDALWLSDTVRDLYVNLFALKNRKSEDQKMVFLRRQLEENNHFISFYVLSLKEIVLGDEESDWVMFLRVQDRIYTPKEIKLVDLSPVYKDIFGKKFSQFKDAYLVYFNAKDIENNFIVNPNNSSNSGIDKIELIFRSMNKEVVMTWDVASNFTVGS